MKMFMTSRACPICGKLLRTSGIKEYSLMCPNCNKYFHLSEAKENLSDLHEINIGIEKEIYTKKLPALSNLIKKYGGVFLGYDDCSMLADFGWDTDYPKTDDFNNFIKELCYELEH